MEFNIETPRLSGSDSTLTRILTADPDPNVRGLLNLAFRLEGWHAIPADDGATALAHMRAQRPDLVVTELAMPDIDGLVLLGRMRSEFPDTPVLVLAGEAGARRRVGCLAVGADDYVAKPFNLEEVMLRLKGIRRRNADAPAPPRLVVGDLELDEDSREVNRGGHAVDLTDTEFRLLRYLMRNPRRVLSKSQILHQVWSYDFQGRASIVELYISYLRRKIGHGHAPMIHTVRGVGYVLKPH
ncbi:response regulator transcription factor [Glycomyces paridis]|uniref:Response regulator transcription factor n=1 Tax=Glycomyces paridis TaxID=2126555 RepID=A0A4S8PAP2_9ACTN|nr:response regulator transcription factor [Glycomyces paridis]THV26212.1 response regulator transcription factor [Glycomyces paridis]